MYIPRKVVRLGVRGGGRHANRGLPGWWSTHAAQLGVPTSPWTRVDTASRPAAVGGFALGVANLTRSAVLQLHTAVALEYRPRCASPCCPPGCCSIVKVEDLREEITPEI